MKYIENIELVPEIDPWYFEIKSLTWRQHGIENPCWPPFTVLLLESPSFHGFLCKNKVELHSKTADFRGQIEWFPREHRIYMSISLSI